MKRIITVLALVIVTINANAQKETPIANESVIKVRCGISIKNDKTPLYVVDGVPMNGESFLSNTSPEDIVSIKVIKEPLGIWCYGAGKNGVVLVTTKAAQEVELKANKEYSFKVYSIKNLDWVTQQDVYNGIRAKVPSIQISANPTILQTPKITLRGDDTTIVILDGVRYDASILNTINPADIESIKVAPSVAATNYFRNASVFN